MKSKNIFKMWLLLSALWLTAGCSVIDDDLSDCYQESNYRLEYQLKLITNMTTEISTKLNTVTETSVANALKAYLKNIFTDYAHDVDLSFYDTDGSFVRLHHDTHIMDANQKSYTLTLPMRQYRHLAVANIADDKMVDLNGDEYSNTSALIQDEGTKALPLKYILPHTTGVFSARESMDVLEGVDQTFNVRLYMVNSAVTLVIDPMGQPFNDIQVFSTGFASSFFINDSTYVYSDNPPLVKADKVATTGTTLLCYTSVNFPSRDADAMPSGTSLWHFKVYVTKTDGTITETILDITEPLQAGELKIIKGSLDSDCAVRPYDPTVGCSVSLNWNSGGSYDPEL